MKQLNIKEMDKEEKELYQMLISKFNKKEMKRLAELMIIDAEKYHQEWLKKNSDKKNKPKPPLPPPSIRIIKEGEIPKNK